MKIKSLSIGIASLLALASTHVFAASITEELVVTAQKREESVAEVPIAIKVLSEDQINNSYSANIESLQFLTPSVTFLKASATHNSALFIRGLGTVSFSFGIEPSVAVVVDGVVQGRIGQAFADLYEIQRIEVLKGPQGTLFGKNASTGVISITTKRPTEEFEGYINVGFFSGDEYRTTLRLGGALTDNVNASITAYQGTLDGYIFNRGENTLVNGYDRSGFRAMIDYKISDDLKLLAIVEQYSSNDDCCYTIAGAPVANRFNGAAGTPFQENWKLQAGVTNTELSVATPDPVSGVVTQPIMIAPSTTVDAARIAQVAQDNFDNGIVNTGSVRDITKTNGYSLQLTKDMDGGSLVSITSYRSWDHEEINDEDLNSQTFLLQPNTGAQSISGPEAWNQFSQEIRFDGESDDVRYSVGGYIWHQAAAYDFTRIHTGGCGPSPLPAGTTITVDTDGQDDGTDNATRDGTTVFGTGSTPTACVVADSFDTSSAYPGNSTISDYYVYYVNEGTQAMDDYRARLAQKLRLGQSTGLFRVVYENQALFFNLNAAIDENWGITAGARYTADQVKYDFRRVNTVGFSNHADTDDRSAGGYSDSTSTTNLSSKFGFEWKDDANLAYMNFTQGYKGRWL